MIFFFTPIACTILISLLFCHKSRSLRFSMDPVIYAHSCIWLCILVYRSQGRIQKKKKNIGPNLKAHVRDKSFYGMLTSGLYWSPWLIPHNVLLNEQNAGSADKASEHDLGPTTDFSVPSPESNSAVRITLHTSQDSSAAGFLRTEIVWHTSQSPHTITRDRIAILIGAWGLAVQRWVWTNEKPYFSFAEVCALILTYWRGKWGNSYANRFLFGKERGYCPCRKGACHGCVTLIPGKTSWGCEKTNKKQRQNELTKKTHTHTHTKRIAIY